MHSVTILFCSVFVSCVPLQFLFLSSNDSEQVLDYDKLKKHYYLAFESRLSRDYAELDELVSRTQVALTEGKLTAEQRVEVRRWQHKLRSFIAFAKLAMHKDNQQAAPAPDTMSEPTDPLAVTEPAEEKREAVRGLATLILNRLRTADADLINPEEPNDNFYRQTQAGGHDTTEVSKHAKDSFARALVSKTLQLTEQSMRQQYRLFPFAQQGYITACQDIAAADCQQLQMQQQDTSVASNHTNKVLAQPFTSVAQVTEEVNKTINKINNIITQLSNLKATKDVFFIFKETDFDSVAVMRLYHSYEMALFKAARRGFLPIMLTSAFRSKSGNIYLQYKGGLDFLQRLGLKKDKFNEPGDIRNPLLVEASHAVVAQAISEIQRATIERLVELRQRPNKKFSDKELYQWSIINEVATAQVILQEPAHGVVVNHLLDRFQYKNRDPLSVQIIRGVTEAIEISMFPLLLLGGATALAAAFPVLATVGLTSKLIIAVTAANFVWVGMAGVNTAMTHQRWMQLEHALLTGSSERYEDALKLLREFHKTRSNAIISGTIGLPMSVPSIKYALNHMYSGSKTLLIDMVAGVFSARDEFGYEGLSDAALHEGH